MANCFPSPNSLTSIKAVYVSKFLLLLTVLISTFLPSYGVSNAKYSSIYSFGDYWADTGNSYYRDKSRNTSNSCMKLPYGKDFSGNSTGRCSNGRLIIDFIAEQLGLPHVKPYFGIRVVGNAVTDMTDIQQGVNFAVSAATSLDPSFFVKRRIPFPRGYCLRDQLDWFKNNVLPSVCASPSSCRQVFNNSLFLMGEIGGNDYLYSIGARKGKEEVTSMVPKVINKIISGVKELINLGAVTLLVPGTIPFGCNTIILTVNEDAQKEEYDQFGCLRWLNELAEQHNQQLQIELHNLRMLYPHVNIIYGDYYNVMLKFVQAPTKFGFLDGVDPLKCCCGGGGVYDYNMSIPCGNRRGNVCDDPSRYVYWDGAHLTEAAYRLIAQSLLAKEPFSSILEMTPADDLHTAYLSS